MFYLNRGIEFTCLKNKENILLKANFDKFVNVLDPLNNYNNLGKSINYHSKSRMDKVMPFMRIKLQNIKEIRKTSNPLLYMNSLLNLYKDTLTMIDLDLFEKYIKFPKILVNNKMYKKLIKKKENLKFNLDKSDIDKFNSFFTDNKTIIENNNLYIKEEEDSDEYEEDKKIESDNDLEEEDEDKYEEDEIDNFEENNEISEESEEDDMNEIKDVNFEFILNKEILKTLFYLYENKESNIDINNKFITQSKEYSNGLEKFLQEHNLV